MEDERQVAGLGLDGGQLIEVQASPVRGVGAVDVADAAGQEVNAQLGDGRALVRIGQLALSGDAVLGAADAANLSLNGEALLVGELHELLGVLDVDVEVGLVGTIVHDGGEAGVDALEAVLVRTVIEVHGDGDGDVHGVNEVTDDVSDDLEALLPLGGTSGALDDDGSLRLLSSGEDGARPLKVIGVECGDAVVTSLGGLKHTCSVYEHLLPPGERFASP